ncbi:MAG: MFS transporter [Verrucomicrobia bacterium]|nr:MFS transporter [Verrucomicrobiota bacterium]
MHRPPTPPLKPIAVIAGMAGNMMEWYDFALYGVMAPTLGKLFFPQSNHLISILSVFGVFAAGYIMRLGGGAFFGHIADHYGRRIALLISATLMAITTSLVGFLPTYAIIGIGAPLLLVVLRLIQGLSTGGEFITSITYLVENAPPQRRGLIGTLAGSSACVGLLLGSAAATILFSIFSHEQVINWAWRIPFLASIPLGLSIAVLRTSLPQEEKPDQHVGSRHRRSSVLHVLIEHPWAMIRGALGGWAFQTGFYTIAIFMSSYLVTGKIFLESTALGLQSACLGAALFMAPLAGYLSDRFGRKPIAIISLIGILLGAYPLLHLVNMGNNAVALAAMVIFMLFVTLGSATYQVWLAEIFPRTLRATGLGISYNVSAGILGGTTPLICVSLIAITHNRMVPALFLIVASAVSLLMVLGTRETGKKPLK